MTVEMVSVVCPTLTFHKLELLSRQLKVGIFSKQSLPKLESQVLIKFVDEQPTDIMCPHISERGCGNPTGHYWRDCHFKKWSSLKEETKGGETN